MHGKHRRMAFMMVLGLALIPATLLGTSVVRLGTQDLLEMSPTIIMGEVLEQETRLAEDGGYPITLTTIAIEESFKGAPRPIIEVFTLGGQVDDLIGEVPGENSFTPGERVFLFLSPKEGWENTYTVYGMFQGKWSIQLDERGEEILQNDHIDNLLIEPAKEVVPLNQEGHLNLEDFVNAVRHKLDLN
ncbi:MAG: hypothetical protein KJ970_03195 [Candidatus Eisenbacteria bacterium]|uniref:Uncharacterized protein n=1 Tax=Eiseniibacteriota bacterium TaxID=2212470 RepID=A0A948RVV1_UNCEI|nr:hypothetical protein [Candidatus Eisenbacteria bacterium]MBU1950021.1 hypothetical protein [Candidatus Eisenbacteria bacterium]MBU2689907.1 hypothetical protein [Candidatus Eisenbacteria bacterium]